MYLNVHTTKNGNRKKLLCIYLVTSVRHVNYTLQSTPKMGTNSAIILARLLIQRD